MGHLEVNKVEYWLPDGRLLLSDINFRVGDGSKVAIVGPNGSGKTTLIRMISGDIEPHGERLFPLVVWELCDSSSATSEMTPQ